MPEPLPATEKLVFAPTQTVELVGWFVIVTGDTAVIIAQFDVTGGAQVPDTIQR